jgi:hypothetical protein
MIVQRRATKKTQRSIGDNVNQFHRRGRRERKDKRALPAFASEIVSATSALHTHMILFF